MNKMVKTAIWLGKQGGADLRPWSGELEFANSQIETLTLALDKVRKSFLAAVEARSRAEQALRRFVEGKEVIAPSEVWGLVPLARELAAEVERTSAPGTSGEFKRHVVLAEMAKKTPASARADLSLALELALRSNANVAA